MNKMTLKEKIEVIKAYAEGKPVDAYDTIFQRWFAKGTDTWDFDREEYRIRPNSAPKFKVGDRLVYKSCEGYEGIEVYEVTEATQEYYRLDDMVNKTPEYVEKEFINERDVLWCFNIYDYVSKRYSICLYRKTIPEMDEVFAANHDTLSWKPMYNLGFKLKEE
jgi:hypothetical protein